jgi:uncharacterized protein YggE
MKARLVVLMGIVLLAAISTNAAREEKSTLRVMGAGTATISADTVIITVIVRSSNENATQARAEIAGLLNKTTDSLLAAGVNRDEIEPGRSRGFVRYHNLVCETHGNDTTCKDVVTNLVTEQMAIRLKTKEARMVEKVLEAAKSANASAAIAGYSLGDTAPAISEARKKAIENARLEAQDYAWALGLRLGRVANISEIMPPDIEIGQPYDIGPPFGMHHPFWTDRFFGWGHIPGWRYVPPGMVDVTAYVAVTYEVS